MLAARYAQWSDSNDFLNALVALLGVAFAAELSSVSLFVGTATMSISFIPFLAAVFLFDQLWAMLIGGTTFFVVDLFVRKKPWIKVLFNASKEVLAIGLAGSTYEVLGGNPTLVDLQLGALPVLGAGVLYLAASSLTVSLAVSLSEGLGFRPTWARLFGGSAMYDVLALPLPALLAFLYGERQLLGLVSVVIPLFVVRHIYVQNLRLEQSGRDLLDLMVKAIEARDPYTSGHSQRVKEYARIIAKEAGLSNRHVEQIATAALLHDVGKIYEEYAPLLRKDGKLTVDEKKLLQSHPVRSAELVATISSLRGTISEAVRHHHENYDGTGYPDGFAGDRIPLGARVIMIADTLDAMTTDRPYRRALPYDRVVEEIRNHAGRQFDPRLAEIVVRSSAIRRMIAEVTTRSGSPGEASRGIVRETAITARLAV
ncbi:MAG TPA: HD-GYP domain-containing protein [Gemmatimonadales bacterium]|nr:HD-GYP domain-containing protein [Gemmatimonadales bacterium]